MSPQCFLASWHSNCLQPQSLTSIFTWHLLHYDNTRDCQTIDLIIAFQYIFGTSWPFLKYIYRILQIYRSKYKLKCSWFYLHWTSFTSGHTSHIQRYFTHLHSSSEMYFSFFWFFLQMMFSFGFSQLQSEILALLASKSTSLFDPSVKASSKPSIIVSYFVFSVKCQLSNLKEVTLSRLVRPSIMYQIIVLSLCWVYLMFSLGLTYGPATDCW